MSTIHKVNCAFNLSFFLSPLHQRAYFSFWQRFHLFLLFGTQFFAWCFLSILSWILEGFKRDPTKKLRCLDTFFNFWPFLLVGKATSLWQKLHWDSLWMQLFFLKPLQFKRLWVVPSWHEWGTHCAKTGLNLHPQSHIVMDACWISTQIVGFPTILSMTRMRWVEFQPRAFLLIMWTLIVWILTYNQELLIYLTFTFTFPSQLFRNSLIFISIWQTTKATCLPSPSRLGGNGWKRENNRPRQMLSTLGAFERY